VAAILLRVLPTRSPWPWTGCPPVPRQLISVQRRLALLRISTSNGRPELARLRANAPSAAAAAPSWTPPSLPAWHCWAPLLPGWVSSCGAGGVA